MALTELLKIDEATFPLVPRYRPVAIKKRSRSKLLWTAIGLAACVSLLGRFPSPWDDGALGIVVIVCLVWVALSVRKALRVVRLNSHWLEVGPKVDRHFANGDLQGAEAVLEEMCDASQGICPYVHAAAVWRLGLVHARRGDLDKGSSFLASAVYGRPLKLGIADCREVTLLEDMGIIEALRGDLERAEDLQRVARELLPADDDSSLLRLDAVVGARKGEWKLVVEAIEQRWRMAEPSLRPHDVRVLRIVEAFAMERLAANHRSEPRESQIERVLMLAQVTRRGEVDYLGKAWPDLADFLRRRESLLNAPIS